MGFKIIKAIKVSEERTKVRLQTMERSLKKLDDNQQNV